MADVLRMLKLLGVEAKPRPGGELWAPCPKHEEAEPSWSINAQDGSHYCFGCGFSGGPVELVMQCYQFAARASAIEWLDKHGLNGQVKAGDVQLVVGRVGGHVFQMPPEAVFKPLAQWPSSVRRYVESRGITAAQVERWGLGYAVEGRLEGRIVFPFRDESGRLASYSARSYTGSALRYRTPAEREQFDSAALFGPQHWPAARNVPLVLAEGAIDALACERAGAMAIAALSGSRPSAGQLARLASFGVVVVATDPDQAGERVWRQLQPLRRWSQVHRAKIPRGKDAASMSLPALTEALCLGSST